MIITHVSTRIKIKYGGGEKFLENLITNLTNFEHIFIGQDPVVYDIFKKHGFEAHNSPAGYEPITLKRQLIIPISFVLGFLQFVKYFRIWKKSDIIIASASSIAEPVFLFSWIKLFFPKKRLIQSMHSMCVDYYWRNPLVSILRKVWSNVEFIYISKNQMSDWHSHNLKGNVNHLIYNGVQVYDLIFTDKTDISTINIGYIGRMYYQKGIDTMIEALSKIDYPGLKINVLMAGDGEDLEKFKKLQNELKMPENINFSWLGFQSDTKSFYEKCDLIIFPSWIESFGLVLVEAWERGLPVITSDIPAFIELKQYAQESEQKLIFKLKDSSDLILKLQIFLENRSLYTSDDYKQSNHQTVLDNFSFGILFKKYSDLFKANF